jgi:hypothetical protein
MVEHLSYGRLYLGGYVATCLIILKEGFSRRSLNVPSGAGSYAEDL